MKIRTRTVLLSAAVLLGCAISPADTEIKIGNIMPYTGAFSEYGATGRAEAAYFQMINDQGGVNGRKIKFISLDSGSDTNKAVALAHQLVEQDQVLATVGIWGTPANMAIRPYLNEKKVPLDRPIFPHFSPVASFSISAAIASSLRSRRCSLRRVFWLLSWRRYISRRWRVAVNA